LLFSTECVKSLGKISSVRLEIYMRGFYHTRADLSGRARG